MASQVSGRFWIVTIVLVIIALAAGAFAMWLVQRSAIRSLEERVAYYEQNASDGSSADETPTPGSGTPDSADGDGEQNPGDSNTNDDHATGTETVPTLVTGVRVTGGVTYVTLDYIQFLTGEEAADMAAARGDESPPPNDYYIVNDNPELREYPVEDGIIVGVVFTADGMSVPEGLPISLAEWVDGMSGPMQLCYTDAYYIVTVTDGAITALDQQYLP